MASHEEYAARLYELHHGAIFRFCLKQLRHREDADDAVQMTFMYALLSLRRGIVPQLELPWLFTIARNVCSTRRRSSMRRGANESPQDLDLFQDKLATPDRSDVATTEDFTSALRALPHSQRTALLLREWRGFSYEEIGMELGLSQAATEALLFRARQNVTRRLDLGLKTLQGLPFLSFIRNAFGTAAGKVLAIGAGAALTVVAVPAAQPGPPPAPRHAASHLRRHFAPTPTRPGARPPAPVPPRAGRAQPRSEARAVADRAVSGRRVPSAGPDSPVQPPSSPRSDEPPARESQVAPLNTSSAAQPLDAINGVSGALELPVVPPVSLPPTPELPVVTVQTPAVPSLP